MNHHHGMAEIAGLDIDELDNNGPDIDRQFSSLTVRQHTATHY